MTYHPAMSVRQFTLTCLCSIIVIGSGCIPNNEAPQREASITETPTPWQPGDDGWMIALPESMQNADLAEAIAKAKDSTADARTRWLATPETQREHWAVKWAAPLDRTDSNSSNDAASVEHLWVLPLHWSAFRIEGRLLSQPVGTLPNGRKKGDLVSFPIEDLSDWVYFVSGEATGERIGGFTIDVLEDRYGSPPDTPPTPEEVQSPR